MGSWRVIGNNWIYWFVQGKTHHNAVDIGFVAVRVAPPSACLLPVAEALWRTLLSKLDALSLVLPDFLPQPPTEPLTYFDLSEIVMIRLIFDNFYWVKQLFGKTAELTCFRHRPKCLYSSPILIKSSNMSILSQLYYRSENLVCRLHD